MDTIEVPNVYFNYKSIPEELRHQINEVFDEDLREKFPDSFDGIRKGVIDCFFDSFRTTYLLAVVSNPMYRYHSFANLALKKSEEIAEWIETGTKHQYIVVVLQPELVINKQVFFQEWELKSVTMAELCIEGYNGRQSKHEALMRVAQTCFFRKKINKIDISPEEITQEVDILVMSLWLGLGTLYRPQDLRFECEPWNYAPDKINPFTFRLQPYWENSQEIFQSQTFIRLNSKRRPSFYADPLTDDYIQRVESWIKILQLNKGAIFSFNMIWDGTWKIARSIGELTFRRDKLALEGIFRIIAGMEGLISECKPKDRRGFPTKTTQTFIECWYYVWSQSIKIDPDNTFLTKAKNIREALKDIYSLRSDLAHADLSYMSKSLKKVKESSGDLFNPGQYDPVSVGMSLSIISDELLEYFYNNEDVLEKLLKGDKPIAI